MSDLNFYQLTGVNILENLVNLKQITFEVTDGCNLRCKYCGYGELYEGYDLREYKLLPINKAKYIIDYLIDIWRTHKSKDYRRCVYVSFYGGEPLLNMDFVKYVIGYIEEQSPKVEREFIFSMTTNAMLLDKYMDYLKDKKVKLLISLDGDEAAHSYRVDYAGKNSFSKVFANIKLLQKTYPDYFSSLVHFNSVLHNRNNVEGIFRFIEKEFSKQSMISELSNSSIKEDKKQEFNNTYRNKYENLHQSENYEKLSEDLFMGDPDTHSLLIFLHRYSNNTFKDYGELLGGRDESLVVPTGTCTPFSKKMFVTVNGKILPCERIDHKFALGMIGDDGVQLDFKHVANYFNSLISKLNMQCGRCNIRKSCTQCIYYINGIELDNPVCNGFANDELFRRYVLYNMHHLSNNPHLYRKLLEDVLIS